MNLKEKLCFCEKFESLKFKLLYMLKVTIIAYIQSPFICLWMIKIFQLIIFVQWWAYLDLSCNANDQATLSFTLGDTTNNQWKIKVCFFCLKNKKTNVLCWYSSNLILEKRISKTKWSFEKRHVTLLLTWVICRGPSPLKNVTTKISA